MHPPRYGDHEQVEIAELVLKYIEALVWPAVTVGLVWGLRSHIRDAFARMSRLETPAGAIEFETQARDVLNQAEAATMATPPAAPATPPYPWSPSPAPAGEAPAYGDVQEGLGPSPREAPTPPASQPQPQGPQIPTQQAPPPPGGSWAPPPYTTQADAAESPAWGEQLTEARTMVDASPAGAVVMAWNALLSVPKGALPPDTAEVYNRLRTLRNQAVHQADTVTPAAARDFVDSCLHVVRLLRNPRRP